MVQLELIRKPVQKQIGWTDHPRHGKIKRSCFPLHLANSNAIQPANRRFILDLFDFFFPEQAQASHLRKIANNRPQTKPASVERDKIDALRRDVNFLTLVLTSILKRLDETKTLSLGDVQDILSGVDTMDGIADNGLDPKMLRGLLGALDPETNENSSNENDEFKIVTTPRYRR